MKSTILTTFIFGLVSATFAAPNSKYDPYDLTIRAGQTFRSSSQSDRHSLQSRDSCSVPEDISTVAPKPKPFVTLS